MRYVIGAQLRAITLGIVSRIARAEAGDGAFSPFSTPRSTRRSDRLRLRPRRREHRRAGVNMLNAELQSDRIDCGQETDRLAALTATGILDSEPEASYDAITRLSAQYFQADTVLLGFADESRIWIKSYSGQTVREFPRQNSICDMVLAEDGPVVISDISKHPHFERSLLLLRRLNAAFFASVPVRSSENQIQGALTIFCRDPRQGMEPNELRMLENLADMVASQLELRRLRNVFATQRTRQPRTWSAIEGAPQSWPSRQDLRRGLD